MVVFGLFSCFRLGWLVVQEGQFLYLRFLGIESTQEEFLGRHRIGRKANQDGGVEDTVFGCLAEKGIEVGEEGLHEIRAAEFARAAEFV